jgi:hypothetical protein
MSPGLDVSLAGVRVQPAETERSARLFLKVRDVH